MAELISRAKVCNDFDLVEIKIQDAKESERSGGINHVICIDTSGSMCYDVPKIKLQLKSNLVNIVQPDDTVTILTFSSSASTLVGKFKMKDLKDSKTLNSLIDKMDAYGCTNFVSAISLTKELMESDKDGLPWNFIFMSDGYHNTGGPISKVFEMIEEMSEKYEISSSFIVEYGYYSDSATLDKMASSLGAVKIFDEDFDSFSPDLDDMISNADRIKGYDLDLSTANKKLPIYNGILFSKVDDKVIVYKTDKKYLHVRGSVDKVYYLSKNYNKRQESKRDLSGVGDLRLTRSMVWSAALACINNLRYDVAEVLVLLLDDPTTTSMFSSAYGKQKIEELKSYILCLSNSNLENSKSVVPSPVKPNMYSKKYCLLDFLSDLSNYDGTRVHISHKDFVYSPTGAKSVAKVILTDEDKKKLFNSSTKTEAEKILDEASSNQVKVTINADNGIDMTKDNLIWNSNRANVSIQMSIPVILSVPNKSGNGRFEMDAKIFRNYTVIRDGVLNISKLPISVTDGTFRGKLKRMGLIEKQDGNICVVDLTKLPIINRYLATSVTSVDLASKELKLMEYRYIVKYLGYLRKLRTPIMTVSSEDSYLESLGIRDGVYSPKSELKYSGDSYVAPVLDTKLEKFSTSPKVEDVLNKAKSGTQFTESERFMNYVIEKVNSELSGRDMGAYYVSMNDKKNQLIEEVSKCKFGIILSRGWFQDKEGYDDNEVSVVLNDHNLKMRFVYGNKTIKL